MTALDRLRLRLLILVMRYSGLAIVDAATLTNDRIQDGHLVLRRAKSGVPVTVRLPEAVIEGLSQLPLYRGRYYFWNRQTGDAKPSTQTGNCRRRIRRLLPIAGIQRPNN